MRFGAIANSARGGPPRPPPVGDRVKAFSIGPKFANSVLTQFRTGRTGLNLDKFTLGQTCDPGCLCHYKSESSEHYLLDCFLYIVERQNLYNQVEHYIPNFRKLTKKSKISNSNKRDKYK